MPAIDVMSVCLQTVPQDETGGKNFSVQDLVGFLFFLSITNFAKKITQMRVRNCNYEL